MLEPACLIHPCDLTSSHALSLPYVYILLIHSSIAYAHPLNGVSLHLAL